MGKYSVGYFVSWGIYDRKFPPSLIPVGDLTHVVYAFANVNPDSGEVHLSDAWADKDIHYDDDEWIDDSPDLYGNFKRLYLLKKDNRHLKTLLSIGGWNNSSNIHPVVTDGDKRAAFVESAVKLLEDYGLDGLDIDYEYPEDEEQAEGYVELLRELRSALDDHASNKDADYHFLLTAAAACGPVQREKLKVADMDESLDFWNLMSYDFSGPWDGAANHTAPLNGDLSVSNAVEWYAEQGVDKGKLVLGIPLYGRSFTNTDGPGHPFEGSGPGSFDQGVYDYRALPLPDHASYHDPDTGATHSYNEEWREMISYDDEHTARQKGEYIDSEGLGGAMYWELSGDKGSQEGREELEGLGKDFVPGPSIICTVNDSMGDRDDSENWLGYEGSQFPNVANNMEPREEEEQQEEGSGNEENNDEE